MAEENRCCTCTTPEITIKLNKQGPQGLTGPQGEPGFSPVIEVSEETPTSYRLSIQTINGSYETPNLKANFPLGGYVNQVLVKQSNADGDATWDYIPYATTETTGGLTLATEDDVVVGSDKAITGDILAKVVADFNTALGNYVDKTSTQSISGAKTFNTLSTHYLNALSGEIQAGGITVIAKENDEVSIPGYSSLIRVGGNLPLLIKGASDVVRIWRDGSSHIIVDADNIGSYIPSVITNPITFSGQVTLPTWTRDTSSRKIITCNPNLNKVRFGDFDNNTVIGSDGEIVIDRTAGEYTNLDSGNISSDPYIVSLVSRIEALES